MSFESRLFDYILARSRSREQSILTVASIAAGASLVLFGLFVQVQVEDELTTNNSLTLQAVDVPIKIIGILFAIVGFLYREVSACTIHKTDEDYLKDQTCLSALPNNHPLNRRYDTLRATIIRVLLALPIIAWSYLILFSSFYAILGAFCIMCFYVLTVFFSTVHL